MVNATVPSEKPGLRRARGGSFGDTLTIKKEAAQEKSQTSHGFTDAHLDGVSLLNSCGAAGRAVLALPVRFRFAKYLRGGPTTPA
jgi:hypothetical protein